jgi:oligoribonuclease
MIERDENLTMEKTDSRQFNLVWMDLEMSGLDPEINTILEIATIITDGNLEIISEGPVLAVYQDSEVLHSMDDWNKKHHSETGLIERVRQSAFNMRDAEMMTLDFIKDHIAPGKSPLCGNSICQDRRFLIKYMPALEGYLHYRNIDVSSIKELYNRWYPDLPRFEKENAHSALKDIHESISELQYYRRKIFIASVS